LRHVSVPLRDKYRRMSAGLCKDLTVSTLDLSNRTRHYVWVSLNIKCDKIIIFIYIK
jgi:hypothetical protein